MSIHPERSLQWNVFALALAGPALLAFMFWIINRLSPSKWCGVLIGSAKISDVQAPQCTQILLRLLDLHRDAIWILGGSLGLVIVAIGLAATGMTFRGKIAGSSIDVGRDAAKAADEVAGAAVNAAEDVKAGQ